MSSLSATVPTRIGVLGTGRMGLPIARNLKSAGFEVFAAIEAAALALEVVQ